MYISYFIFVTLVRSLYEDYLFRKLRNKIHSRVHEYKCSSTRFMNSAVYKFCIVCQFANLEIFRFTHRSRVYICVLD